MQGGQEVVAPSASGGPGAGSGAPLTRPSQGQGLAPLLTSVCPPPPAFTSLPPFTPRANLQHLLCASPVPGSGAQGQVVSQGPASIHMGAHGHWGKPTLTGTGAGRGKSPLAARGPRLGARVGSRPAVNRARSAVGPRCRGPAEWGPLSAGRALHAEERGLTGCSRSLPS